MGDFIQSWAYVFIIIAFVLGWIAGFILAIILASSGRGSRMEEKIEKDLASRPIQWRVMHHFNKPETEIATQGKPEDA